MTAVPSSRTAIVFDTETTGLIENSAVPLKSQPHIIELHAIKLDLDELNRIKSLDGLTDETIAKYVAGSEEWTSLFHFKGISPDTTKITGIDQEMVNDAPKFATMATGLGMFFLGAEMAVGHNLSFDRDMLDIELRRLSRAQQFPWPPIHVCTVEASETMTGFRLGLNDLHERLTGQRFNEHHRAAPDTRATARCFVHLIREGVIRL